MTQSKLIAVTGGSGFVGTHVVDALLSAGHEVRVIDQVAPRQSEVDWVKTDILDEEGLTRAFDDVGPVFHLAAMADVNDVVENPDGAVAANILGTSRILKAAQRAEAGRVFLSSTVWVYSGAPEPVVDEATPLDLMAERHLYASTKIAAEMLCRDHRTLYGRPYTILRYGIPFGPYMRDRLVIAAFIKRAMRGEPLRIDGDGRQERTFIYVEDLARAHALALVPAAENRTYNLEANEAVSIRQLAELVGELVGNTEVSFGDARAGDFKAVRIKADRAREELGWEPKVSFREGLERTLAWYRAEANKA